MKKIVSMLLVLVMLVSCMTLMAAASEVGEEVTVSFTVTGNPGFACYGAKINYDHEVLTLVAIEKGELSTEGFFSGNPSSAKVGFANATDITGDGVLFTATFKINESAKLGQTYTVTAELDLDSTANAKIEPVSFTIKDASITVACPHKHTEIRDNKDATCDTDGYTGDTWCTDCGNKISDGKVISATGHSYKSEVTKKATCTEDGEMTYTCEHCGHSYTEVIKAAGHNYKDGVCSDCGAKDPNYSDKGDSDLDDVPATGDVTCVFASTMIMMFAIGGIATVVVRRKHIC